MHGSVWRLFAEYIVGQLIVLIIDPTHHQLVLTISLTDSVEGITNAADRWKTTKKCESAGNHLCGWQHDLAKCHQKYLEDIMGTRANWRMFQVKSEDCRSDVGGNTIEQTKTWDIILYKFQIPIHKGSVEPLMLLGQKNPGWHGANGMCDVEFWEPGFPDPDDIPHPVNAIQAIRDLVMKVSYVKESHIYCSSEIFSWISVLTYWILSDYGFFSS